jgi:hypothetical protein
MLEELIANGLATSPSLSTRASPSRALLCLAVLFGSSFCRPLTASIRCANFQSHLGFGNLTVVLCELWCDCFGDKEFDRGAADDSIRDLEILCEMTLEKP